MGVGERRKIGNPFVSVKQETSSMSVMRSTAVIALTCIGAWNYCTAADVQTFPPGRSELSFPSLRAARAMVWPVRWRND